MRLLQYWRDHREVCFFLYVFCIDIIWLLDNSIVQMLNVSFYALFHVIVLLLNGWRRCGYLYYHLADKPQHCIERPIILDVDKFVPSRSQRRVFFFFFVYCRWRIDLIDISKGSWILWMVSWFHWIQIVLLFQKWRKINHLHAWRM